MHLQPNDSRRLVPASVALCAIALCAACASPPPPPAPTVDIAGTVTAAVEATLVALPTSTPVPSPTLQPTVPPTAVPAAPILVISTNGLGGWWLVNSLDDVDNVNRWITGMQLGESPEEAAILAELEILSTQQRAFYVIDGTRVTLIGTSSNLDHVTIASGPYRGTTGWAPAAVVDTAR
jgi:hypothetical protein